MNICQPKAIVRSCQALGVQCFHAKPCIKRTQVNPVSNAAMTLMLFPRLVNNAARKTASNPL